MQSKSIEFKVARSLRSSIYQLTENTMLLKVAAFLGFGIFLSYLGYGCLMTTGIVFLAYLVTGGYKFTWIAIKTFKRDLKGLTILFKLSMLVKLYTRGNMTVPKIFAENVLNYPRKPCFIFEDKTWTFTDVDQYSNAIANYFLERGYKKDDTVALFMENRPEFVCFWLGFAKIGIRAALINFNLRDKALAHCLRVSGAKVTVFGGELSQAVKDVLPLLGSDMSLFCFGTMATNDLSPVYLDAALQQAPRYPPPEADSKFRDKLFYIYTSGTTGLPKAAVVSHTRFFYMTFGSRYAYNIERDDVIYNMLPLYHTAGGILGVGQALLGATTVVIRRKFSASQFWTDCVKYECTVAQYIGEIARYLLSQPFRPEENKHKVRLMFGNGLRPQIWESFQKRFGIQHIGEFYGATEGNCNIVNFNNKIGAVGFTTRILPFLYPVTLIRIDEETGKYMRDRNGMCIHAEPGQPGELVGKIVKGNPLREFDGYADKQATSSKIVENVFRKGDSAFLTGDVLVMDEEGYMYFRDRTGDTFRWRGENVSTSEVEAIVSNSITYQDAVVYGVEVPGCEGRAGMATIVDVKGTVDLQQLNTSFKRALPVYARPVFVRLAQEVNTTGTFKLVKTDLREEGFNPNATKDRIFYMNHKSGEYEPVTPEVFSGINSGKIRL
ncbi:long-chain fatty acid transport protein 4-like [Gigantopelta aegis]|uniref:long-chain fatty acid transport protein 4-like n=1 Tax=Gigantopelta aegis TaxID=1735272 RepID=UPI001B88C541|nr:long-chain fatty acid transport protein 4-like [Gigantopelta aegis]